MFTAGRRQSTLRPLARGFCVGCGRLLGTAFARARRAIGDFTGPFRPAGAGGPSCFPRRPRRTCSTGPLPARVESAMVAYQVRVSLGHHGHDTIQ